MRVSRAARPQNTPTQRVSERKHITHGRRRRPRRTLHGVQRHAPPQRRPVPPPEGHHRHRRADPEGGADNRTHTRTVCPPDPKQTFPRHELLRLGIQSGKPRQGQLVEQLQAQGGRGARAARHVAHGEERPEPQDIHELARILRLDRLVRGRHHAPPTPRLRHLPHAAGTAIPYRYRLV